MDEIIMGDKIQLSNQDISEHEIIGNSDEIIISDKKEDFNKHYYYEIRSPSNLIKFDYILFKNYYVATITLLAYCGNESLCLLNNYTIMSDANTEEDSERFILISSKEFEIEESKFKELQINSMKLYIFQPSLLWNDFYLKNLKIINSSGKNKNKKFIMRYHLKINIYLNMKIYI